MWLDSCRELETGLLGEWIGSSSEAHLAVNASNTIPLCLESLGYIGHLFVLFGHHAFAENPAAGAAFRRWRKTRGVSPMCWLNCRLKAL